MILSKTGYSNFFIDNLLLYAKIVLDGNLGHRTNVRLGFLPFCKRKGGNDDKMSNSLGRHVLAEIYGCSFDILNDREQVETIMVNAALEAGAEVREVVFHKFSPQGVSGVVVISESHLAIHTWPELGYAAVDVFTCGDRVNPWDACNYVTEQFNAGHMTATEMKRGIVENPKEAVNL